MKIRGFSLFFLLCLVFELIPHPGVSQIGGNFKRCCSRLTHNPRQEDFSSFVQYGEPKNCPFNKVQFMLRGTQYCFLRDKWVLDVLSCIGKGRDPSCLKSSYPDSNKEFSIGGSIEQPLTTAKPQTSTSSKDVLTLKTEINEPIKTTEAYIYTTRRLNIESPSSIPNQHDHMQGSDQKLPTSTGPSTTFSSSHEVPTQSRNVDRHEPTKKVEIYVTAMPDGGLRTPDSNPNGNKHLHGQEPPIKEKDKKINELKTTIIILMGIILLCAAIVIGVWCSRRSRNKCNLTLENRHQGYKMTVTDDSSL